MFKKPTGSFFHVFWHNETVETLNLCLKLGFSINTRQIFFNTIRVFDVVSEVNCVSPKWRRRFKKSAPMWPSMLFPNIWRYKECKLFFSKEEEEVWNYCAIFEFWRYIRSTLRFTKKETEVQKSDPINPSTLYPSIWSVLKGILWVFRHFFVSFSRKKSRA